MPKKNVFIAVLSGLAILLSGCVVRTYELTKERVDQDLAGNRGYLSGGAPQSSEVSERPTTRTTRVVEVEVHPPIKFAKGPKKIIQTPASREEDLSDEGTAGGNRGYIFTRSAAESAGQETQANFTYYTVKKNDTLQKISKALYGTTKKWNKIYTANQDTLKSPNRLYPGQVLKVPKDESAGLKTAPLAEAEENLK
jgi:LysM repeat protein